MRHFWGQSSKFKSHKLKALFLYLYFHFFLKTVIKNENLFREATDDAHNMPFHNLPPSATNFQKSRKILPPTDRPTHFLDIKMTRNEDIFDCRLRCLWFLLAHIHTPMKVWMGVTMSTIITKQLTLIVWPSYLSKKKIIIRKMMWWSIIYY